MNIVIRNVLLGGLLCLSVPLAAQVPQDLIDKAKAAGMTDEQIRQEMNKRMGQSGAEQTVQSWFRMERGYLLWMFSGKPIVRREI